MTDITPSNFAAYKIHFTKAEEYALFFSICDTSSLNDDEALTGYIKWDGCSNWKTPDGFYGIHLCGAKHIDDLKTAIEICYDYTKSNLPTYYVYGIHL